jgi:hypothetical protein
MRPGETNPQLSIRFRTRISASGRIEVTLLVLENELSREDICFGVLYLDENGLGSTVLLTGRNHSQNLPMPSELPPVLVLCRYLTEKNSLPRSIAVLTWWLAVLTTPKKGASCKM